MPERAARGDRSELSPRALRPAPVGHAPVGGERVDVIAVHDDLRLAHLGLLRGEATDEPEKHDKNDESDKM